MSHLFLAAVLGSVTTLGFVAFFYGGDISKLLTESQYLLNSTVPELSRLDQIRVSRLLEKNVIFSADDLLGQIGTLYTTIITTLISLITVMSLFTFFFIKSSVEEKAEAQAKATAKQVIEDKITPKMEQMDTSLSKFDEQSLNKKLDVLLQTKILDSLSFWSTVKESIYAKAEEALQDYDVEKMRVDIDKTQNEIKSITENIQLISQELEKIQEKTINENDNVIDLGNG
jgi:hypothetical protein